MNEAKQLDLGAIPNAAFKAFVMLSLRMNKRNCVNLSGRHRQDFADLLGISKQRVVCLLNELVDYDLIFRVDRGEYMVNPKFVSKAGDFVTLKMMEEWGTFTSKAPDLKLVKA